MPLRDPDPARRRAVPPSALCVAFAALLVPVAGSGLLDELGPTDLGLLLWISVLIPGFLLSYYRGWEGSAITLAAAMAVVALSQLFLSWRSLPPPSTLTAGLMIAGLLAFSVGIGLVTELLHRERRMAEERALADPLTGLPNRRHAEVFLEAALPAARANGTVLSVVVFDLDHFKRLNDAHGHAAGDEVIRAFAGILRTRSRPEWLVARVGGEEFLAVMPEADSVRACEYAEAVRAGLSALDIRWQPLTASAGVAELRDPSESAIELLSDADRALYRAKELGRDRVERASRAPADDRDGSTGSDALPQAMPTPRGVVILPDPRGRTSVRRVLELSGLRVDEYARLSDASAGGGWIHPAAVVVSDASGTTQVDSHLAVLDLVAPPDTPRVIFVTELDRRGLHQPARPGLTVLEGPASGDRLLPHLPGILATGTSRITLPHPADGAHGESRLLGEGRPLTSGRVVVVDDERSNRIALQRTLDELGFDDVISVASGQEALEAMHALRPDLLILDLHMPEMDGFEVLSALQSHIESDGFLPILVVTGDKQWEYRQRALRMGAKDFLNKPFDVSELGARVLNLLETRQLHLQMKEMNRTLERRVWKRTRELARAKDEILFRLAQAAEYRDDVTGRHAERVGAGAAILAEALGLDPVRCDMIRRAAPLHDVGKIAIPDAILLKEGALTPDERAVMQSHTIIGGRLLADSTSDIIEQARIIALTHHERWDGLGYPAKLRGAGIPLEGRIVALIDALDALTHARPYKVALSFPDARDRLWADAGAAFDPEIVSGMDRAWPNLAELMRTGA